MTQVSATSSVRSRAAVDGSEVLTSIEGLREMPMMPAVAIEAMQVADNPETSAVDLAKLVERDMTLATEILRVANSSLYGFSTPADSVNRAVVRLGVKGCQNLVLVAGMTSLMRRLTLRQEWIREVIWRHAVLTGMMCRQLNRLFQWGFQGEEFTGGLVHDIGRLLLSLVAEDRLQAADPLEMHEGADILEQERRILGTDHCEAGALFARRNQLPPSVCAVIRCHHHLDQAEKEHRPLVAIVSAADHMASHIQRTFDTVQYDLDTNPALPWILQTQKAYDRESLEELLPYVMDEAVSRCRDFCRS